MGLATLEPGRADREAKVSAAQTAHDAAAAKLQAAKTELKEKQTAVASCEEAVTVAESEFKNIKKTLRLAQESLEQAEAKLSGFQSGPLLIFRELATPTVAAQEPQKESVDAH